MNIPYRCETCQQLVYTKRYGDIPKCCPDAVMTRLENICLVVHALDNEHAIFESKKNEFFGIKKGIRWKTVCEKSTKPTYMTDQLKGATCKDCLAIMKVVLGSYNSFPEEETIEDRIEEVLETEASQKMVETLQKNEDSLSSTEESTEFDDTNIPNPFVIQFEDGYVVDELDGKYDGPQ